MIDAIELTKRLIALPTVEPTLSSACASSIANLLVDEGYVVKDVDVGTRRHFLAQQGTGSIHVGFISHYDIVPPGEGWHTPPYTPTVIDDVLYGRGAADMKSGLAAQIVAGRELSDLGLKVSLFIAGDEEGPSEGMPALLAALDSPVHYAICGEPTSERSAGDTVKVGRRGVVQGELIIQGKQGHAAYVDSPKTAIHSAALVVPVLHALPGDNGNEDFPPSTCVVTYIAGGNGSYNVVPGAVTLRFDARLSPATTIDAFEEKLREQLTRLALPHDLTITKRTGHFHTRDKHFRDLVASAIEKVTGRRPQYSCDGGTSDARFFAEEGIPVLEVGVPHGNMHGIDEHVHLSDIETLCAIYTSMGPAFMNLNLGP